MYICLKDHRKYCEMIRKVSGVMFPSVNFNFNEIIDTREVLAYL